MNRVFPRGTTPDQIAQAVSVLVRGLDFKKSWKVSIEEFRSKRSNQANAYLWGVVYPSILEGAGEMLAGWERDDLHQFFLMEHFGEETLEIGGRTHSRPFRGSSSLNREEFTEYLEFLSRRAAELGIAIPEPSYDAS
jgi:hypothetical protein